MKTFIALIALCWFGALAWAVTVPAQAATVTHVAPVPALEVSPPTVEVTSPEVIQVGEITIVGHVPAKHPHVARKTHFVCGDWRPLVQGSGNVQECEWK